MSCIAGLINLDGAPVDRELLKRMTSTMENRAPDEIGIWCSGNVGFGHAMLRISPDSVKEHQPCTLDGKVWITADARIDGRDDLMRKIRSTGLSPRSDLPDAELILYAYDAFGESFLEHLIGDFSFALWDDRRKRLICVRDHFGVRPFFYAKIGQVFLFASDIDALHEYPSVSRNLDEEGIGDFLLFGDFQNRKTSIYRDIRRLPAANIACVERNALRINRYWELSPHNVIRYGKDSEYLDRFKELFSQAVEDRLHSNRIAIQMSGGLDSTAIAAASMMGAKPATRSVTAYTTTCNCLLPDDQEGHFANEAAMHLGIPIFYQENGDYAPFERFGSRELRTSEPVSYPVLAAHYDSYLHMQNAGCRVMLTGQGGDAVFNNSNSYYAYLLHSGRIARLLYEAYLHVRGSGSLAGMGLRSELLGSSRKAPWQPDFPDWIASEFIARAELKERWEMGWETIRHAAGAYSQMQAPWVSSIFETYETLKMPRVVRHPFFDLRLAQFLLGLPTYMKSDKRLLREAMWRLLPETVRARPKTSLVGDHVRTMITRSTTHNSMPSLREKDCDAYIDANRYKIAFERYLSGDGSSSTWSSCLISAPIALNFWLAQQANAH